MEKKFMILHKKMLKAFFLFLGFFRLVTSFAQSQIAFPPIDPLFVYENTSDLTAQEIICVGIAFSGGDPDSSQGARDYQTFLGLAAKVLEYKNLPQIEQAEKVLSVMYGNLLTRYKSDQTKLDVALQNGTYNCVSASILYLALAKTLGLNVKVQRTPSHAFCSVYVDGKKIDVEATNPSGFNPGTKKMLDEKRYFVVPKKYYNSRHEISDRMAVSLIARNISANSSNRKDYKTAISFAATRYVFMKDEVGPDNDALKDFTSVLSNYTAYLTGKKQFQPAVIWCEYVQERWPQVDLSADYDTAVYNYVAVLCNANRADEALDFYVPRKTKIFEKTQKLLEPVIFSARVRADLALMKDGNLNDKALAYIESARENALSSDAGVKKLLTEMQEYFWLRKVQDESNKGDWLSASKIADAALAQMPTSAKIKNIKKQCLYNYDVVVHNKFVKAVNSGKYDEALEILDEGLKNNPTSSTLLSDKRALKMVGR